MDDWQLDRLTEDSGDEDDDVGAADWVASTTSMIFLIDAAKEMFDKLLGDKEEDPPFKRAVKAARATTMRKAMAKPYDQLAVVFFNTRESKNSTEYNNVYVFQDLQRPSAENVLALEEIIDMSRSQFESKFGHTDNASMHDTLRTCQSVFASQRRPSGKSILLFTCRDDPHAGDPQRRRQAVTKARDLKEYAIDLEILHMGASFDVNKFYKDLVMPEDTEEEEERQGNVSRERRTLANPATRLDELMNRVRLLDNKQRVTANLKFTLGPGVEMTLNLYTVVRKPRKPSQKKLWKKDNQEVRTMIKEYLLNTGELITRTDYDYFHKYANAKICLTMDEARNIVGMYETGMQLLGFRPKSWIKGIYYYQESKYIYPKEKGTTKIFTTLLERCLARQLVAIVRLQVRQRTSAKLAALVPQKEKLNESKSQEFPPGFWVYHLPFADNFCIGEVKSRPSARERQVDAAKRVIRNLRFEYHTDCFDNPDAETMKEIIQALALNRSQMEPVIDDTVPNTSAIDKQAGPQLRELDRLVFTAALNSAAKTKATAALLASKRVKIDSDNLDVETMVRRGQAQQLSVPVLKSWLTARGISITGKKKAELMQAVIDAVCA